MSSHLAGFSNYALNQDVAERLHLSEAIPIADRAALRLRILRRWRQRLS